MFGAGDKHVRLSEGGNRILLGSVDDQVVVKDDSWYPWGVEDACGGRFRVE